MTEQPQLPLPPPGAPTALAVRPLHLPLPRPPWWVRLMERVLAPWIEIKREPSVPPFVLDRPVCYVMEHYGLSNALIESTNTKIRLLTRMAFGYQHPGSLIALAMLNLGGHRPTLPDRR